MKGAGRLVGRLIERYTLLFALCLATSACELLPSDGPNANNVLAGATENVRPKSTAVMRFALVGIDAQVTRAVAHYYRTLDVPRPLKLRKTGSYGLVGVGDLLRVTVWEAGSSGLLKGGGAIGSTASSSTPSVITTSSTGGTDIIVRVDVDGTISLPYAGRFAVVGRRTSDVEKMVAAHFEGKLAEPQSSVLVLENVANTVSVQGEVDKPGSYPLTRLDERVLDVIAVAGGAKFPPYETTVRLTRGGASTSMSLQDVIDQPTQLNPPVAPGDAVLIIHLTKKFLALGAVVQPGDQIFRKSSLTISDALGQTLGLDSSRSDAKAVYLFRREPIALTHNFGVEPLAEDRDTIPIVYQLNLRDPRSFFEVDSFPVRPGDIMYVSTAPLAEVSRFFQILSGATSTVAIPRTLVGNYPTGR